MFYRFTGKIMLVNSGKYKRMNKASNRKAFAIIIFFIIDFKSICYFKVVFACNLFKDTLKIVGSSSQIIFACINCKEN